MNIDAIREYCLRKSGNITEDMPFGDDVLVFRVDKKIFVLARLNVRPLHVNLKCDPEKAIDFRERYESVIPGYHMNKKCWNTLILDGSIPTKEILAMIDHSFDEVLKRVPKNNPRSKEKKGGSEKKKARVRT